MLAFDFLRMFDARVADLFQVLENLIHVLDLQSAKTSFDTAGYIAVELDGHGVSPDFTLDSIGDCLTHDVSPPAC